MFQILDGTGEPFAFTILLGIYKSVANIYDRLLTIAQYDTGSYEKITMNIESVAGVMYVLAGIFMLFRVTIAMINVLIDPDKLNDRQAGAGKILVRVVTSILMLIIFVPNGIVFNKDTGILARFESAVLNGDDGLVNKLFPTLSYDSNKKNTSNKNHTFLADDVYADVNLDKMKKLDCYYIAIRRTNKYIHYYEDGFLHITFYPNTNDSSKEQLFSHDINGDFTEDDMLPISYEIEERDDGHGLKYIKPNLSSFRNVPILDSEKLLLKEWSCPNYVTEYGDLKRASNGLEWSEGLEVNGPVSYIGGYGSSEAMFQGARDHNVDIQANGDGVDTSSLEELLDSYSPTVPTANANDEEEYLESLVEKFDNDESLVFAQNALATFITCTGTTDEEKNECKDLLYGRKDGNEKRNPYTGVIANRVTNNNIKDKLKDNWFNKDKIMSLDFVTAMIAGVGLFVWIAVLCVDIFIRRFKLILLEMMAPIPIISYSDPNDKMFNQWGKMYISTYAELFLKLFAMAFAIRLLATASEVEARGLEKFFLLVAILVFAKTIPDIISKVTGLNINTGTFKNIVGMGKAALGFGAGAAIGGAVGLATGISAFKASKGQGIGNRALEALRGTKGVFSGLAQGAGSGSKGNILGGAKNIAATNASVRNKYASGLKASHLLEAATLGQVGMNYAARVDRQVEKDIATRDKLMKLTKHQGAITKLADEGGLMQAVLKAQAAGHNVDPGALQNLRLEYAQAMLDNKDANAFKADMERDAKYGQIYKDLFADTSTFAFEWSSKDSFIDGGVQAQILSEVQAFDDEITGSPSLARAVGFENRHILSVKDVKKANLAAWGPRDATGRAPEGSINALNDKIREKTVRDPKYNASKAARNSSNSTGSNNSN